MKFIVEMVDSAGRVLREFNPEADTAGQAVDAAVAQVPPGAKGWDHIEVVSPLPFGIPEVVNL